MQPVNFVTQDIHQTYSEFVINAHQIVPIVQLIQPELQQPALPVMINITCYLVHLLQAHHASPVIQAPVDHLDKVHGSDVLVQMIPHL